MRKSIAVFLAAVMIALTCSVCMPAFAEYIKELAECNEKTTLLVQFEEDTVLESNLSENRAISNIEAEREDAVQEMEDIVDDFEIGYSYTNIVNGITVDAEKGDIKEIEKLDGVSKVYEIGYVKVLASETVAESSEISSGSMIGLDKAREMGYDGKGTAIAIIDGGFDSGHETMTLSDPSTAKYSKDDIKKILNSGKLSVDADVSDVYVSSKIPFAYDYCENNFDLDDESNSYPNHGTHVSGIAAGNSNVVKGVAPEAQVIMLKVDVYDDTVFFANLLAALDDAAKFDVSSVNMSLGLDYAMPDDPQYELLAEAFCTARNNGITLSVAAGNAGMYTTSVLNPDNGANGVPGSFDGAFSVASVDNINLSQKVENLSYILYGDGKKAEIVAYGLLKTITEGEFVVVTSENYSNVNLKGKFALVCEDLELESKICDAMSEMLRDSGCLAVITASTNYSFEYYYAYEKWFSLIEVGPLDAYRIAKCGNSGIKFVKTGYYVEPAEDVHPSEFTSYGVSEDLKMTVDIAAPGGIIYSSVTYGAYDVFDGTSMAAPHIAGTAALLDQYFAGKYPNVKGSEKSDLKENIMMSTADLVQSEGVTASPRAVGAGLVNIEEAFSTNAVLTDGNDATALNIGDEIDDTVNMKFTIKNISDAEVTYDTFDLSVITDGYVTEKKFDFETGEYIYEDTLTGSSVEIPYTDVSGIPESVTLPAGSEKEVSITVKLDSGWLNRNAEVFTNGFYVEGYILVSDSTGKETPLNIPFMGFRGDWEEIPAVHYGEIYEEWLGMEFYLGEGYMIDRSLRSLKLELVDGNGDTVLERTLEYVKKGTFYLDDDIVSELAFDYAGDGIGGTYSLRMTALMYEDAEPFVMEEKEVTINIGPIDLISAGSEKNSDGTYDITVTASKDNITYFEISGSNYSNMNFYDVYPVDGPDYTDESGNKVYILRNCRYGLDSVIITAYNDDGIFWQEATIGRISALLKFIQSLKAFFASIKTIFSMAGKYNSTSY